MPKTKNKKRGRPKSKKKLYFGPEVQDAIVRYNTNPDNHTLRNKIYGEEIHKAFDKLAENIINTFKFSYFDDGFNDVKHEVVAFMVMNLHKYDHTKGSKAFSYFSVVAKNYLILHNNNNYKKYKSKVDISTMYRMQKNEKESPLEGFSEKLIEYFSSNIPSIFKKKREEIENFNKKALYILIREMTNVNTSKITSVVNVLKKHYKIILNQYQSPQYNLNNKINKFFR